MIQGYIYIHIVIINIYRTIIYKVIMAKYYFIIRY